MTTEKINFRQTRDFGQKLNATFEFIKQNLKSLVSVILRIVGLPILLVALIWGGVYFGLMNLPQGDFTDPTLIMWLVLGVIAGGILMIVFGALYYGTIYEYIKIYMDSGQGEVAVTEVISTVRRNFSSHLVTVLALIGIMFILSIVPVMFMIFLVEELPALSVLIMFVFMGVLLYIYVCLSLFVVIRVHEKRAVIESISRSFEIIKGKWWSTFGLILVCGLIQSFIGYLVLIPFYVIVFAMGFSGGFDSLAEGSTGFIILSIVFYTVYIVVALILTCLTYIAIAFQYYNLVELKEATGLMDKIEEFTGTDEENEQHY